MKGNKDWLAALTGAAFLVVVIASFLIGGEPPNATDDSAQEVVDFYVDNEGEIYAGVVLEMLAATLLVLFGGYLRKVLRAAEGEGHMLSAVAFAGTVILATGAAIDATLNIAMAEAGDDVEPAAIQALNVLWQNDWVPMALGAGVLMLAAGLSIVRHGALPAWLGWVAIVIWVVMMTPVGFVGFLAAVLWIVVVSIMLSVRARKAAAAGA